MSNTMTKRITLLSTQLLVSLATVTGLSIEQQASTSYILHDLGDGIDNYNQGKSDGKDAGARGESDIVSDVERVTVKAKTENMTRLDVFLDDRPDIGNAARFVFRPQLSIDVISNSTQFILKKPRNTPSFMKIEGFKDDNLVAVHRAEI